MSRKDVGKVFGRLTVLQRIASSDGKTKYKCLCSCGKKKVFHAGNVVSGKSRSCGCLHLEIIRTHNLRHTTEYNSWDNMIQRCHNPNRDKYEYYGGRGIKVCDRWRNSFENFVSDMGMKPSKEYTIERVDNDGNYEPTNCKWATRKEQRHNQREYKKRNSGKDNVVG